jgi:maltose O-acetyltransferase
MMGPHVTINGANHNFERTDIPMRKQGVKKYPPVVIEDDVWIGSHVIIMPGLIIKKGTIIGAGAIVTKDFPAYSVIGGNPAKLIKSRLDV